MAKILLVIDCLGSGGAQRQLVSLAKNFQAAGHQVEFFIYYPQFSHFLPILEQLSIPVHSVNKKLRFSLKPIWHLRRLLKKDKFDAALAFMQTPAIYMEISSLLNKMMRIKVPRLIFSERTSYSTKQLSFLFKLSQQCHRLCDDLVVNSFHQKEKMLNKFPWMGSKLTTIYNGLDAASFKEIDKHLNMEDEYLLCISRVVEYKNYQNLALALIDYKNRWGNPPKIIWVGKIFNTPNNINQLEKVKKQLALAGLEHNLDFIGEKSRVEGFYQNASALIHPSFIEGFSNVVMEACRYSLPLLLGNIGDHQKVLSQYEAGVIFDVKSPSKIADTIHEYIVAENDTKEKWKQKSFDAYEDLFQMQKATENYLSLLLKGKYES